MGVVVRRLSEAGALVSSSESRQYRSGYVVLEPGKEVGEHETGDGEELIVFTEGSAELSYGGKRRAVRAPAVALVPAHTSHNVSNRSKAPLHYVYIYNAGMDRAVF